MATESLDGYTLIHEECSNMCIQSTITTVLVVLKGKRNFDMI